MDKIVNMMVGRDLEERFPPKSNIPGDVHLSVKNISTKFAPMIHNVSFDLRRGEILGIAGLVGAGRSELVEAIFGVRTRSSGELFLDGKPIQNRTPQEAIKNRFALLTEERRATGIYPLADITFNSTIANVEAYKSKIGLLQSRKMLSDTDKQIASMRIKTPSKKELIRSCRAETSRKSSSAAGSS